MTTLTHSPTETVSEKKIWGSTCCNVGVMCRGIGKEHYHICNKCNKKCEVKYEKPVIELSEHDWELIKEGRAMSDFDTRRGV